MDERTVGPFSESVVVPIRVGSGHRLGPSRGQLRGPGWRRTSQGFYVPADTPRTTPQRIVEASVVVPEGGGITGWAALHWMGGRYFDGTSHGGRVELPVTIVSCRPGLRRQAGLAVSEERLNPRDLVVHDGLSLTSAVRSTFFEMRHARSVIEATVAADMSALADFASYAELGVYIGNHPGWTGIEQARKALSLMSENSWSPMETRLRLLCVLYADMPALLVNRPVFDLDGRFLGTPDLLDLETGLAVEYDGADHLKSPQRLVDVLREDKLEGAGLLSMTVLKEEFGTLSRLIERLKAGRQRAAAQTAPRPWTVDPPPWWRSLDTVELRRADRDRRASA